MVLSHCIRCKHTEPVRYQAHHHKAPHWAESCMMILLDVLHVCRINAWSATLIQRLVRLVHWMLTAAAYRTQLFWIPGAFDVFMFTASSALEWVQPALHACAALHAGVECLCMCSARLLSGAAWCCILYTRQSWRGQQCSSLPWLRCIPHAMQCVHACMPPACVTMVTACKVQRKVSCAHSVTNRS
jgi:hypothetical protein